MILENLKTMYTCILQAENVQTGLKIFLICLYTCIYIVSKIRVLRLKMAPLVVLKIERVISLWSCFYL